MEPTLVPELLSEPLAPSRRPATGNFSAELKAPAALLLLQAMRSAVHSGSVGKRYPLGQGLFTPLTPCHKLVFGVLRQSPGGGVAAFIIKLAFAGVSVPESTDVVVLTAALVVAFVQVIS